MKLRDDDGEMDLIKLVKGATKAQKLEVADWLELQANTIRKMAGVNPLKNAGGPSFQRN